MADSLRELQESLCRAYDARFEPPRPGTKVGIALQTFGPCADPRHSASTHGNYLWLVHLRGR